jgi:hypothetical protein
MESNLDLQLRILSFGVYSRDVKVPLESHRGLYKSLNFFPGKNPGKISRKKSGGNFEKR